MTVYANAGAFKQALEARLRAASTSGVDFGRRRQLLVFDRFLARLVRMVEEDELHWPDLGTLVGAVQAFLDPLLAGRVTGTWTPTTWS